MLLPTQNKLMLLLLSPRNPWWRVILDTPRGTVAKKAIREAVGIGTGAWHHLEIGVPMRYSSAAKLFDKLRETIASSKSTPEKLQPIIERLQFFEDQIAPLFEEEDDHQPGRVYQLGKEAFGFSISTSQRILDHIIYAHYPLFPTMLTDTGRGQSEARDFFKSYGGTYRLWMRRDDLWLRCGLRVRYLLKIRRGMAVRCKLNVAKVYPERDGPEHWEYDGFVKARSNKLFWTFEKRARDRGDYIHFITDRVEVQSTRLTMAGRYFTTGQDSAQAIVSDDVILQRITASEVAAMEAEMHSAAMVLRGADMEEPEAIWRAMRRTG